MSGAKRTPSEQAGLLDDAGGSPADPMSSARKEIVLATQKAEPGQKIEVTPYPQEHDAWHAAIKRLHQIPEPAHAKQEARDFALDAGGVNGISHVQCVRFTGLNGRTLEGGEFQVGGKRIFKSGNDTYSVEKAEGGAYALRPQSSSSCEPLIAKRIDQITPLNNAVTRTSDSIVSTRAESIERGLVLGSQGGSQAKLQETLLPPQNQAGDIRETPIKGQMRYEMPVPVGDRKSIAAIDITQQTAGGQDSAKVEKPQMVPHQAIDALKGNKPMDDAVSIKLSCVKSGRELAPEQDTVSGGNRHDIRKLALECVTERLRNDRGLILYGMARNGDSKLILGEVLRIIGRINEEMSEVGINRNVCFKDILSRTLHDISRDGRELAAGEVKATLPRSELITDQSILDRVQPVSFIGRLTQLQEEQFRAWLELRDAVKGGSLVSRLDPIGTRTEIGFIEPVDGNMTDTKSGAIQPKILSADLIADKITKPDATDLSNHVDSLRPDLIEKPDLIGGSDSQTIEGAMKESDLPEQYKNEPVSEKENKVNDQDREDDRQHLASLALMAQMRARKEKVDKTVKEKGRKDEEDGKRMASRRRRYKVKEYDTLESIAAKELGDIQLAVLIYELNRNIIPKKIEEEDKEVIDLKVGLLIWLPSDLDVKDFRGKVLALGKTSPGLGKKYETVEEELRHRLGAGWASVTASQFLQSGGNPQVGETTGQAAVSEAHPYSTALPEQPGDLIETALATAKARRANVEKLLGPIGPKTSEDGRLRYVVRLGDTLRSIAMRHPALQDVSLWRLLAQVNDLPVPNENRVLPGKHLSRGMTLIIPSSEEIDKFRKEASGGTSNRVTLESVTNPSTAESTAETVAKPCKQCGRLTVLSATICPACKHPFDPINRVKNHKTSSAFSRRDDQDQSKSAEAAVSEASALVSDGNDKQNITKSDRLQDTGAISNVQDQVRELVELLSDSCRLVRSAVELKQDRLTNRIEVRKDNDWKPVVSYEIYSDVSLRHEYLTDGRRKTIRIDLPPKAAYELASNDLNSNWKEYEKKYLEPG